jgi:hypothetical protein
VCTENVTFLAKELKILLICINPKLQHTFIPGPHHSAHTFPGVANSNLKTKP